MANSDMHLQAIFSGARQPRCLGLGAQAEGPSLTSQNPGLQVVGSCPRQSSSLGLGAQAYVPRLATANPDIQIIDSLGTQVPGARYPSSWGC